MKRPSIIILFVLYTTQYLHFTVQYMLTLIAVTAPDNYRYVHDIIVIHNSIVVAHQYLTIAPRG